METALIVQTAQPTRGKGGQKRPAAQAAELELFGGPGLPKSRSGRQRQKKRLGEEFVDGGGMSEQEGEEREGAEAASAPAAPANKRAKKGDKDQEQDYAPRASSEEPSDIEAKPGKPAAAKAEGGKRKQGGGGKRARPAKPAQQQAQKPPTAGVSSPRAGAKGAAATATPASPAAAATKPALSPDEAASKELKAAIDGFMAVTE